MAERKFSNAMYIDIPAGNYFTAENDPKKLGFESRGGTYFKDGKPFTGFAPALAEAGYWRPDSRPSLYINGVAAQGLINDKFYIGGVEQTKEQIQQLPVQTIANVAGELAALGLRTPTGRGGEEGAGAFVRDAAAEKQFIADFKKVMARTASQTPVAPANAATTGGFGGEGGIAGYVKDKNFYNYWANASDDEIIRLTGGVNKEGRPASAFGINDLLPPGESKFVGAELTSTQRAGAGTPLRDIFGTGGAGGAGGTGGTGGTGGAMTYTASDGRQFKDADAYVSYQKNLDQQKSERKSAYDLLYQQFAQYGLGVLVEPLRNLIQEGVSPSEFTLRLRDSDAYKKRFAANAQRVNSGLRALSEAEYIQLEDQYQDVMRRYGMPESYYKRGDLGIQQGFEKFLAGDVSPVELEDRIQTAQARVFDANPEVAKALSEFYPGITNGDILAYALDPKTALPELKRKITAAEIGAGAMQAGLPTSASRAEELQRLGVTKAAAQQGFQTIAGLLPRASQLGDIYAKQGMGPFTQTTAEAEVFGTSGAAEAAQKRRKLSELEQAQFGGSTGIAQGALGRERAGQF